MTSHNGQRPVLKVHMCMKCHFTFLQPLVCTLASPSNILACEDFNRIWVSGRVWEGILRHWWHVRFVEVCSRFDTTLCSYLIPKIILHMTHFIERHVFPHSVNTSTWQSFSCCLYEQLISWKAVISDKALHCSALVVCKSFKTQQQAHEWEHSARKAPPENIF